LRAGAGAFRNQRFVNAAGHLAKAVQANPRFSVLCVEHSAALALAGRTDDAKAVAKRVLELEPNFRAGAWETVVRKFMLSDLWRPLMDGVRLAGLPE
jgi:adenylate cyclase